MPRRVAALLLPLLLAAAPIDRGATPPTVPAAAPAAPFDEAARRRVARAFAETMRDRYIFPDVGARVAAAVETGMASARFAAAVEPASLAALLTEQAMAVAHDKHLRLWVRRAPDPRAGLHRGTAATPATPPSDLEVRHLRGGIGYLALSGFPELASFRARIDAAMDALKHSRGLIVDLRENRGGEPESVAYLVSFLIPPGRAIDTIVSRVPGTDRFTRQSYRSLATPVALRDVPVWVLTSSRTFSAGEAFAYDMQALRRGTVVGEVTGGGAHPVDVVELSHGIVASIPTERAENAVTGTNWEGIGVRPSIMTPAANTFRSAMQRATGRSFADLDAATVDQPPRRRSRSRR